MPKKATTTNKYARKATRTKRKRTSAATAFPASEETPGQTKSREAFDAFESQHVAAEWWADYTHLRNEGFTWRVAVYISWAASPLQRRWPATLKELATTVLGLKSDKVVYKWRKANPSIDARVEAFRAEPLLRYRSDVLHALIDVASTHDPASHPDRKLYLEIVGLYVPRSSLAVSNKSDWRSELLEHYAQGKLTKDQIIDLIGPDLAKEFFAQSGLEVVEVVRD